MPLRNIWTKFWRYGHSGLGEHEARKKKLRLVPYTPRPKFLKLYNLKALKLHSCNRISFVMSWGRKNKQTLSEDLKSTSFIFQAISRYGSPVIEVEKLFCHTWGEKTQTNTLKNELNYVLETVLLQLRTKKISPSFLFVE